MSLPEMSHLFKELGLDESLATSAPPLATILKMDENKQYEVLKSMGVADLGVLQQMRQRFQELAKGNPSSVDDLEQKGPTTVARESDFAAVQGNESTNATGWWKSPRCIAAGEFFRGMFQRPQGAPQWNPNDWVGLYRKGAKHKELDSEWYTASKEREEKGILWEGKHGPQEAGIYEFRFFSGAGYGGYVASSPPIVVTGMIFKFSDPPAQVQLGTDLTVVLDQSVTEKSLFTLYRCADGKDDTAAHALVMEVYNSDDVKKARTVLSKEIWRSCEEGQYVLEYRESLHDANPKKSKSFWAYDPCGVRHLKLEVHSTRDVNHGMQLSCIILRDPHGEKINIDFAEAPECAGHSNQAETVAKLVDGDINTKFYSWSCNWLGRTEVFLDLGRRRLVSSYELFTANDVPARDPIRWTLAAKRTDKDSWTLLHHTLDQRPDACPRQRKASYGIIHLRPTDTIAKKSPHHPPALFLIGATPLCHLFPNLDDLLASAKLEAKKEILVKGSIDTVGSLLALDSKTLESLQLPPEASAAIVNSIDQAYKAYTPKPHGTRNETQGETKATCTASAPSATVVGDPKGDASQAKSKFGVWQPASLASNRAHCAHPMLVSLRDTLRSQYCGSDSSRESYYHMCFGGQRSPSAAVSFQVQAKKKKEAKGASDTFSGNMRIHVELPFETYLCGAVSYGGAAYVIGGSDPSSNISNHRFVRLVPGSDEWEALPLPPRDQWIGKRPLVGVANRTGHLIVHVEHKGSNRVLLFDFHKKEWTSVQQIGQPPCVKDGAASVATNMEDKQSLWVFGGEQENGSLSNALFEFKIDLGPQSKYNAFQTDLDGVLIEQKGRRAVCTRRGVVAQAREFGVLSGEGEFCIKIVSNQARNRVQNMIIGVATADRSQIHGISPSKGVVRAGKKVPAEGPVVIPSFEEGDVVRVLVNGPTCTFYLNKILLTTIDHVPLDVYPTVFLEYQGDAVEIEQAQPTRALKGTWIRHNIDNAPSPRSHAAVCLIDEMEGGEWIVVSGGLDATQQPMSDLWFLKLTNTTVKAWDKVATTAAEVLPVESCQRYGHSLSYDKSLEALLIWGGQTTPKGASHDACLPVLVLSTSMIASSEQSSQNTAAAVFLGETGSWGLIRPQSTEVFRIHGTSGHLVKLETDDDTKDYDSKAKTKKKISTFAVLQGEGSKDTKTSHLITFTPPRGQGEIWLEVVNPPDSSRAKSSTHKNNWCGHNHNRSQLFSAQAWSAQAMDRNQWIRLDLDRVERVAGVVVQGRHNNDQWVSKFSVYTSADGVTYTPYDGGAAQTGSKDRVTVVSCVFKKWTLARFVRLHPIEWKSHISMRVGVLVVRGKLRDKKLGSCVLALPSPADEKANESVRVDGKKVVASRELRDWKGRVVSVEGWAGWYLDQVTFNMEGNRSITIGQQGGTKRPVLELKEGESIQRVEVKSHGKFLATGITLHTSAGRSHAIHGSQFPIQPASATISTFAAEIGHEIIGMVHDGKNFTKTLERPIASSSDAKVVAQPDQVPSQSTPEASAPSRTPPPSMQDELAKALAMSLEKENQQAKATDKPEAGGRENKASASDKNTKVDSQKEEKKKEAEPKEKKGKTAAEDKDCNDKSHPSAPNSRQSESKAPQSKPNAEPKPQQEVSASASKVEHSPEPSDSKAPSVPQPSKPKPCADSGVPAPQDAADVATPSSGFPRPCPVCTVELPESAVKCTVCDSPVPWAKEWTCPTCTFQNSPARTMCEVCQAPKPEGPVNAPPAPPAVASSADRGSVSLREWTCTVCTMINPGSLDKCSMCQTPKPAEPKPQPPTPQPQPEVEKKDKPETLGEKKQAQQQKAKEEQKKEECRKEEQKKEEQNKEKQNKEEQKKEGEDIKEEKKKSDDQVVKKESDSGEQKAEDGSKDGSQGGSSPPVAPHPKEWACPICTVINPWPQQKCSVCQQGVRPQPKQPSPPPQSPPDGNEEKGGAPSKAEGGEEKEAKKPDPSAELPRDWACPLCTVVNPAAVSTCTVCQEGKRPAPAAVRTKEENAKEGDEVAKKEEGKEGEGKSVGEDLPKPDLNLQRSLSMANGWNCSICTFFNENARTRCSVCGQGEKPKASMSANRWACVRCTVVNPGNLTVCKTCGAPSPDELERRRLQKEEEERKKEEERQREQQRLQALVATEHRVLIPPYLRRDDPASALPVGLAHAAAAGRKATMYVMGGLDKSVTPRAAQVTAHTWVRTDEGAWDRLDVKRTFTARYHARACSLFNFLFLYGGIDSSGRVLGDLWVLDLDSAIPEWQELKPEGTAPAPTWGGVWQAFDHSIWLFGGAASADAHACSNQVVELQIALSNEDQSKRKRTLSAFWINYQLASTPKPRTLAAYARIGNQLYIFGGQTAPNKLSNELHRLDTERRRWASVPLLTTSLPPAGRKGAVMGAHGHKLFLIGGKTENNEPCRSILSFTFALRSLVAYRSSLPLAEPIPSVSDEDDVLHVVPPRAPRRISSLGRDEKRPVGAAGRGASGGVFSRLMGFARRVVGAKENQNQKQHQDDEKTKAAWCAVWQKLPLSKNGGWKAMGRHDAGSTLVTIGDNMYTVGGFPAKNNQALLLLPKFRGRTNSLWTKAKPVNNQMAFHNLASIPYDLHGHASCSYNGFIFVYGGRFAQMGLPNDQLLCYDPSRNTWYVVDIRSNSPPPVFRGTLVAIANHLVLLNGTVGNRPNLQVWAFSVRNRTWSEVPQHGQLPAVRKGASAALGPRVADNKDNPQLKLPFAIWSFGGEDPDVKIENIEHAGMQDEGQNDQKKPFSNALHEMQLDFDAKHQTIKKATWMKHDLPDVPECRCEAGVVAVPDPSLHAQAPPVPREIEYHKWDATRAPSNGAVDFGQAHKSVSVSEGFKGWATVVGNRIFHEGSGVHKIKLRLTTVDTKANNYALCIGVVPAMWDTASFNTPLGWDNPGYSFVAGTGQKLFGSETSNYASGPVQSGDMLSIIFDSNNRTLTFIHNDTNLGLAFRDVAKGPYVVAVSLVSRQKIEMVWDENEQPLAPIPPVPNGLVFWGGRTLKNREDHCEDNKMYLLEFNNVAGEDGVPRVQPKWCVVEAWGRGPPGRRSHMLGCVGNMVYLMGGTNHKGQVQHALYCAEVKQPDPNAGEIIMEKKLPINGRDEKTAHDKKRILKDSDEEPWVTARAVWYRVSREIEIVVSNRMTSNHASVVLQWTQQQNCTVKLIGKGALVVPPSSAKVYAVLTVPHVHTDTILDFTSVVDVSTRFGPSFYMLQPPDDAVPPATEVSIEAGLVAGRRRIEVRGVQVEQKAWGILLKKKEGKYSYLEIHVQPNRNRILRYVKNPLINSEEEHGGCPIKPGQRFVVEIRINEDDYELHINRKFFARYRHRLPYENVSLVRVFGDVCVTQAALVDGPWVECGPRCFHCRQMARLTPQQIGHNLLELQATRRAILDDEALDEVDMSMAMVRRQSSMIRTHRQVRAYNSQAELSEVLAQPELLAPIVWECILTNRPFNDITFPPTKDSIGGDNKFVKRWRRSPDYGGPQSVLFLENQGAVSSDVVQGELGDCYFLGALSIVASRYALFKQIFVPTGLYHLGVYTVRFYKDGMWRMVTVDDQIPCGGNGLPCFGRNRHKKESWVVIAEKAYAKLHHSYHNMDGENGGNIGDALVDLTGGIPEEIHFAQCPQDVKSGLVFKKMLEYHRKGYLLGCGLAPNRQWQAKLGIMENHAYSIIDVREIKSTLLVQLRNPYAKESWKGAWSSSSEVWNQHFSLLLNHSKSGDDDKGVFWMSYYDLVRHFNILFVCKVLDEERWHHCIFRSAFFTSNKTAGGSSDTSRWRDNTQYSLSVNEDDTRIVMSLSQSDTRISFNEKAWYQDIGIYVGTAPGFGVRRIATPPGNVYITPLTNRRAVSAEIVLNKGEYVVVPHTRAPDTEVAYVLKVYYDKKCRMERVVMRTDWRQSDVRLNIEKMVEKKEWVPLDKIDNSLYCSYNATKDKSIKQPIFRCQTCNPDLDVCKVCAAECHKGHVLVPGPKEPRFCDCGKGKMVGACLSLPPKAHWRCRMCSNVNIPARTICGVCGSGDKEFVVEKKDPKTQQSKPKKRKFVKKAIELRCVSSSAEHKAAEDLVTIVASYDKKPPYEAQVMGMSVFSRSKSSSGDSKKEGHMGEQLVDTKLIHSSTFERRHEVLMTLTLSKNTKYLITPWLVRGHTYRVSVFSRSSVWSMRNLLVPPESTAISEEMKKYDQAVHQPNPKDVEELTKMGYSVARSRLAIMECEDRGGGMAKWLDWLARNPHEPEAEKKILCKDQPTKEQASKRGHSESSEGAKSHPPSQISIETKVESGMSVKVKGNERYWLVCALVAGGHWVVQRAGEPKALKAHTEKYIAESWRILDVGDAAEKHDVVKELKVQRLIEEKDFVRLLEVVKIIAKKEGVRREVDPPTQKDTRDKEAITKKVLKGKDVITLLGNALQNETQYSIDDVFRKITEAWGT